MRKFLDFFESVSSVKGRSWCLIVPDDYCKYIQQNFKHLIEFIN